MCTRYLGTWVQRAHYKVTPWFSTMHWSTPWVPNPHTVQESTNTLLSMVCDEEITSREVGSQIQLTVLGFLNVPGSELQYYGLETLGGYRNMGHTGGGKGIFRNRIENFSSMCCWDGSRYDSRCFHCQTQARQQGKRKEHKIGDRACMWNRYSTTACWTLSNWPVSYLTLTVSVSSFYREHKDDHKD